MNPSTPREWHERAIAAERAGDPARARAILAQGLAEWPDNADLHNDAGSLTLRGGDRREQCDYLHEYDEDKMPVCQFWNSESGECNKPNCPFKHSLPSDNAPECPWYAQSCAAVTRHCSRRPPLNVSGGAGAAGMRAASARRGRPAG